MLFVVMCHHFVFPPAPVRLGSVRGRKPAARYSISSANTAQRVSASIEYSMIRCNRLQTYSSLGACTLFYLLHSTVIGITVVSAFFPFFLECKHIDRSSIYKNILQGTVYIYIYIYIAEHYIVVI